MNYKNQIQTGKYMKKNPKIHLSETQTGTAFRSLDKKSEVIPQSMFIDFFVGVRIEANDS